jgi:hypothetical protein
MIHRFHVRLHFKRKEIPVMALDQLHETERLRKKQGEMSFFDHIDELRKHILRAALAIGVIAVIAFVNKDFIFRTLLFGPKDPNFPTYRVLCWISENLGMGRPCALHHPSLISLPANWGRC